MLGMGIAEVCLRLIRAAKRAAVLLNNLMQRLLHTQCAKKKCQIACNALCTGLEDTWAALRDAYGCKA